MDIFPSMLVYIYLHFWYENLSIGESYKKCNIFICILYTEYLHMKHIPNLDIFIGFIIQKHNLFYLTTWSKNTKYIKSYPGWGYRILSEQQKLHYTKFENTQ